MLRKRSIAGLLLLLLTSSILVTGCPPERLLSTSQEIEIGQTAAKDVEQKYGVVEDPELNALVDGIGQTLAQCSDRKDLKYTFKILNQTDVNAFSLPGGWIYINQGLIDAAKNNPDQLAGVISHEIGHVAARHHAEMIGRQFYAGILIGTLTRGDVQKIASVLADLQLLSWNREQEFEADKLGIKQMARCKKYDPQGLIDFFNNLLQMEGREPSEFEQIFRTHPVTSDRIKRAQKYLDDINAGLVEL